MEKTVWKMVASATAILTTFAMVFATIVVETKEGNATTLEAVETVSEVEVAEVVEQEETIAYCPGSFFVLSEISAEAEIIGEVSGINETFLVLEENIPFSHNGKEYQFARIEKDGMVGYCDQSFVVKTPIEAFIRQ